MLGRLFRPRSSRRDVSHFRVPVEGLEARQFLSASQLPSIVELPRPWPIESAVAADLDAPAPAISGNWKLIFHDEFDGSSLNPVWRPVQSWSTAATLPPGELEAYNSAGVSVSNGVLRLTAQRQRTYGRPYRSGLVEAGGQRGVRNSPSVSFLYGYIEVSAKIPPGKGLWPAIWMLPANYHDALGEIDLLETFGGNTSTPHFTIHRLGAAEGHSLSGIDLSQGFHTYGVDWQPDHLTWYIDGQAVATTTRTRLIPTTAMYPIMNLAVGAFGGTPARTTQFPAEMDVDYVRIWQQG